MRKAKFTRQLARRADVAGTFALAAAAQAQPIKIGLPISLAGRYGAEAKDQARNAEMAVKEFNAADGLGGRLAELLVRDDKLNPGEAATRMLEPLEKDGDHFIVGDLSGAAQLSIINVNWQPKVIYVSISQSDVINEASDASPYTFHEALNPHMTTQAVGGYVIRKGMRVAFPTADYSHGQEMTRGFTRVARELGAEIVGEVKHPLGQQERLDQEAVTTSGGEKQMLAIARAVASKPSTVLLDKPSEGIMPVLVDEMFEYFTALKRAGVTILLIEQNVGLPLKIVDRAYILDQSELAYSGTAKAMLADEAIQERNCAV